MTGSKRLRAAAAAIVIASVIGTAAYVATVNHAEAEQDAIVQAICARQDAVIDVIKFIAGPERQAAIVRRGDPAALAANNAEFLHLLGHIEESPCGPAKENR